jgi:hypothetical protein
MSTRNLGDRALGLDISTQSRVGYWRVALGRVEATDEPSTLGTMGIGIFHRPSVGAHFELGRAAVWTRCIGGRVSPPCIGRMARR